ncbi:MAG: hypothetical protein H6672_13965 [Anaerolineaceae bacterium]|nr:hypothetical protein [Anaerolineaceae bacterium]
MNQIMKNTYGILQMTTALRDQMIETLTNEDLRYQLPANPTLGVLCREIGEVQQAYIQSFQDFKMDFSYRVNDPALETSVDKLKAWYARLDDDFKNTLAALSDEDIQQKMIDRGGDFHVPLITQIHIFREALLIFYGKATVYLLALGKPLSEQWKDWVG